MLGNHQEKNDIKTLSPRGKKECFDKYKYRNFQYSSKLEGINITPVNQTIDQLVRKYQVLGNNM